MNKIFILLLFFAFSNSPIFAQEMSQKEIKAAKKEEKKVDKEIKAQHKATSQYLTNKSTLKKANRDLVKDSKKFERQKRREILSPKDIRAWEADLGHQRRRIEKLEADIEKYHLKYGTNISKK